MLNSKKKFKTIITLLLFVIVLLFAFPVYGVVTPTSDFYVNDYAGILSDNTKEHIIQKNINLQSQTGAQIVVVTVPNLEGRDIESYSTELFRKFEIGNKTKNNGLLLLLALEEREFRVEVGYGLEGILPDGKTGRFQDEYIIPYLKENKWDEGVLNGFNAFYKEVCSEYGISTEDIIVNSVKVQDVSPLFNIIVAVIMIIIIFVLIKTGNGWVLLWLFSHGGGGSGGSSGRRRFLWRWRIIRWTDGSTRRF
ncbi:MAG: TPM domain-containing protein [Lachnospiraceae bacterium]|jgi:uncharacterized protein|nr:TPM domain-containing protein [Lachnospiraceae bacterium]